MKDLKPRGRGRCGRAVSLLCACALLALSPGAWAVDPNENAEQIRKKKEAEEARRKAEEKAAGEKAAEDVEEKVVKEAEAEEKRAWFFDSMFNTYFKVIRDNEYSNDVYHWFYLRANYDVPRLGPIPALGRFSLRWDFTRTYVSDPFESGFLSGDIRLYYSRAFGFSIKGQEFGGRGYFYWTFPTSKISRKEGNIARPTALVALSKALPLNITVFLRPFVRLNWDRYTTMGTEDGEGGVANIKWIVGYDVLAMYTFHLHKRLSFGGGFLQDWFNRYSVGGADQPWNSEYYWEVFAGYQILDKPVSLGANLALTSGRQTFEDGVWRLHFVDRDETELYISLNARY